MSTPPTLFMGYDTPLPLLLCTSLRHNGDRQMDGQTDTVAHRRSGAVMRYAGQQRVGWPVAANADALTSVRHRRQSFFSSWRRPLLAVRIYERLRNGTVSVCPSVCLSRRSIAAATYSWFAAARAAYTGGRRVPTVDRYLPPAPEQRAALVLRSEEG